MRKFEFLTTEKVDKFLKEVLSSEAGNSYSRVIGEREDENFGKIFAVECAYSNFDNYSDYDFDSDPNRRVSFLLGGYGFLSKRNGRLNYRSELNPIEREWVKFVANEHESEDAKREYLNDYGRVKRILLNNRHTGEVQSLKALHRVDDENLNEYLKLFNFETQEEK